jgi:molybdenum cofactor biosynthesis enzyme MoaA
VEFKIVASLDFKVEGKFTIVKLAVITVRDLFNLTKIIDLADLSADWAVSISLLNLIDLATIL